MTIEYSYTGTVEHICEVDILVQSAVTHNDINEHLVFLSEQWQIGKIANEETDSIHAEYYSSESRDICIYDTYILKLSLQ